MDATGGVLAVVLVLAIAASFLISASDGLGGSLLMVPTLVLALGAKEGIALAAPPLAANNVFKMAAYRRTVPWRASATIVALIAVGALVGAIALVNAPESAVVIAVLGMFGTTMAIERMGWESQGRRFGPALALVSGATSGFSGNPDRSRAWRSETCVSTDRISSERPRSHRSSATSRSPPSSPRRASSDATRSSWPAQQSRWCC